MKHNYVSPLYYELKKKFFKFSSRLQKCLNSGNFWKLSKGERNTLVQRVEKLRARLLAINPKFAIAAAGLFVATSGAMAQPFQQQTGTNNPASAVVLSSNGYSAPTFGDLDNDGDMDMLIGDYDSLQYFKNTGSATVPAFTMQSGTNSPFTGLVSTVGGYYGYAGYLVPALGDIDGDGDLDFFLGSDSDTIFYFKNTGNATNAVFVAQTGTNNVLPDFPASESIDELAPALVDIDNDGDLDIFVGEEDYTSMHFLRNTGTATAPNLVYENATSTNNPFAAMNPIMTGYRVEPGFGDVDNDGDYDCLVGHNNTALQYFKNVGTASAPNFQEATGTNNPFAGITPNGYFYAAFVDIDGDSDDDFFVGAADSIRFYKNVNPTSSISESTFEKDFAMYPNPANNVVNVNLNGRYAVRITDIAGHVVMAETLNEKTINVAALTSGVYTIEVTQDGNIARRNLVISK